MVTLKDIAEAAGVNITTVSKALSGSEDIKRETANRIFEIAHKMGYKKKKRKNSSETTNIIGIICPEFMSSYYARISTALVSKLSDNGFDCFFAMSEYDFNREVAIIKKYSEKRFAGIVCITEKNDLSAYLRKSEIKDLMPVVQIAMNVNASEIDNICVDERVGVEYAAEHLLSLGHTNIAFLGDEYGEERLKFLKDYMSRQSITIPEENVLISHKRHMECGYELAERLLKMENRPSAIIAEYDDIALGAIRKINEAGLRIPDDISIIGFDDSNYCAYLPIALTTVTSRTEDICEIAVETLVKKLEDPGYKVVKNILIKPDLVVRETTTNFRKI